MFLGRVSIILRYIVPQMKVGTDNTCKGHLRSSCMALDGKPSTTYYELYTVTLSASCSDTNYS